MNVHPIAASAVLLMATGNPVSAEAAGGNGYKVEGAVRGTFNDARCSLTFNKFGKVWILRLTPKDGYSPAANLFFSPKFGSAKPGEYPIKYSYRGKKATLGGSVTNGRDIYSRDTDGTVDFDRFDDRVGGSFSFTSKVKSGVSVSASGSFDCVRGDALR